MKRTLCVPVIAGLLVGCANDPYSGGGFGAGYGNTMKGAGIGALGGAGIGALVTKNRGTGAAIGAAAGALLGAGVGYYMDRQEKQLREQLEGTGVQVQREADNLKVIMPSSITFDTDSANILPSFYGSLNSVAQVLRENDQTVVDVTGHTDSRGTDQYNQRLSERRAQSVASYLSSQGVAASRITSRGMGETSPIASNNDESGRAQNRRVEILIRPVQQPATAGAPAYGQPAPPQPPGYYSGGAPGSGHPAPAYAPPAQPAPGGYQPGYAPAAPAPYYGQPQPYGGAQPQPYGQSYGQPYGRPYTPPGAPGYGY